MAFYIQNVKSGLVVDIKGSSCLPNAEVIAFKVKGSRNQLWVYQHNMLYSQLHGLVLDLDVATGNIGLYQPHGGPNQQWYFDPDGTIRNGTGKVMDLKGGKLKPETRIIAFPKHGRVNQQFNVIPV